MSQPTSADGERPRPRLELVLYVSPPAPASLKAVRNLQRVLARYDASQVSVEISDVSRGYSDAALADRIAFTPTLVRRHPEPRVWLIGNLEESAPVDDLLLDAGVAPRDGTDPR